MPLYHGTLFAVDEKEMLRYAGIPRKENFPESAVREAAAEARALAAPRGIWELFPYDPETGILGEGENAFVLRGTAIRKHLKDSFTVAALAVTVGSVIEETSDACFQENQYVRGLLLDAAATALTEALADELEAYIKTETQKRGANTTWRFSPGYGDWPVEDQARFCKLLKTETIGLTVTDHFMLTPRKSVTAVIGLTPCAKKPAGAACQNCRLLSCAFRER